MYVIYIIKLIILACNIVTIQSADNMRLSDKRLCANKECSVPISEAKTLVNFGSPTQGILSFRINQKVTVFSKDAGENTILWGAEIGGERGYVPKHLIREGKILFKEKLSYLENVEELLSTNIPPDIKPDSVKEAYEVIDGTTVYPVISDNVTEPVDPVNDQMLSTETSHSDKINTEADSIQINPNFSNLLNSVEVSENSSLESLQVVIKENTAYVNTVENNNDLNNVGEILNREKSVDNNVISDVNVDKTVPEDNLKTPEKTDNEINATESIISNENKNIKIEHNSHISDEKSSISEGFNPTKLILETNPEKLAELETSLVLNKTSPDNIEIPVNSETNNTITETLKDLVPEILLKEISHETTEIPVSSETVPEDNLKTPEKTDNEINATESIVANENKNIKIEHNSHLSNEKSSISEGFNPTILILETNPEKVAELETSLVLNKTSPDNIEIPVSSETENPITESPETLESSEENNTSYQQEDENNESEDTSDNYGLKLNYFSVEDELKSDLTELNGNNIGYNNNDLTESTENIKDNETDLNEEIKDVEQQEIPKLIDNELEEEYLFAEQSVEDVNNILENSNIIEDLHVNLEEISTTEKPEENNEELPSEGFFSNIFSNLFESTNKESNLLSNTEEDLHGKKQNIVKSEQSIYNEQKSSLYEETGQDYLLSNIDHPSCSADELNCPYNSESLKLKHSETFPSLEEITNSLKDLEFANFFDIILVLSITGGATVMLFLGYLLIDKCRREGPLIAKVNHLEKALLVSRKENVLLLEKSYQVANTTLNDAKYNEDIERLQSQLEQSVMEESNLKEQVQSLEKELENSTEVGMELNKMISDMLSSQNGSDVLTAHIEQLQNQQHNDIAKYKEKLNEKTTENHELQLEFDINKKKVNDLQTEVDNMLLNLLKIEEERDENQLKFDNNVHELNDKMQQTSIKFTTEIQQQNIDLLLAKKLNAELTRNVEIKSKELDLIKDSMKEVKSMKNNSETLKSLLDMSSVKAELHQLKIDNLAVNNSFQVEQQKTYTFEKQAEIAIQETQLLKMRFDEADKERLEAQTKLEVLASYFKEKEAQLQKELSKHETMWNEKQGEASSTVERIKFMQEELQNYKSQNETLKHEIMSQEVDLKSQIGVLEKKSHEFWLNARQVERKLEDAKQEAAQLRNRLTLQERTYLDDKSNGMMDHHHPLSPLHHMAMDNEGGLLMGGDSTTLPSPLPSMIYGGVHRDHMTASPHNLHSMAPMPPMPPPFLPPPPFMPPPPMNGPPPPMYMHPMPPMPPPPLTQGAGVGMFGPPGDHRPPPLGRISSPPVPDRSRNRSGVCYSPTSSTVRTYSPYDDGRHTPPSPSYDDDDDDLDDVYNRRGAHQRYYTNNYPRHLDSPPHQQHRGGPITKNGGKGSTMSSGGSVNSNASAEKNNTFSAASSQYHHNTNV